LLSSEKPLDINLNLNYIRYKGKNLIFRGKIKKFKFIIQEMEGFLQNERRKINDCEDFFAFLEINKQGRNPRNLCIECLAFVSHYQKIKHREDHTVLTPAAFDSKIKYLSLAEQNNWLSADGTMILLPLEKPPKWATTRFISQKRTESAPHFTSPQIQDKTAGTEKNIPITQTPKPKAKSFKDLLAIYAGKSSKSTPMPMISSEQSKESSSIEEKKQIFLESEKKKQQLRRKRSLKKRPASNESKPYLTTKQEEVELSDSGEEPESEQQLSHFAKTQRKTYRIRRTKKVRK
jgi:hypothetical protein